MPSVLSFEGHSGRSFLYATDFLAKVREVTTIYYFISFIDCFDKKAL